VSDRVLVTPRSFATTSEEPMRVLDSSGCEVLRLERHRSGQVTEEMMITALRNIDGIIVGVEPLSAAVIECAIALRVISKYGVGMDNIGVEAARARGIALGWTPEANSNAVAELTLGLIFALARHIPRAANVVRAGEFPRMTGIELRGRTLGLIGLGRIGRRVAHGAAGLGMRVIAYDPYLARPPEDDVELVGLQDLCAKADFVSLHLPLTTETAGMIGAETLSWMKPGALLINTTRGGVVDEDALYQTLKAGHLGGAAIDCFAHEPPISSPLLELENVIGTPHMGSHTDEAIARMGLMAAENVVAGLRGEPLPFPYADAP